MKKDMHPQLRTVLFHDVSCGKKFLIESAAFSKETEEFEGKSYPLVKLDVSSASHPFYTGKQRMVDTEGRAEKFRKKYSSFSSKKS